MMPIDIPVVGIGPGSQPLEEDGAELDYLAMPKDMATYQTPILPEPEDLTGLGAGLQVLQQLRRLLGEYRIGQSPGVIDMAALGSADRELVNQTLGEGEVSIRLRGQRNARFQETRLAGVWRVHAEADDSRPAVDHIEVADIPSRVRAEAFRDAMDRAEIGDPPEGALNAPSVLTELNDKARQYQSGDEAHVINLTLLPQSEQDLAYLDQRLGTGPASILSRGYGNCRITATRLNRVWWVQHFNSQEKLILNTLEVAEVPAAALAAREDIEDSAARLTEILEALQ